MPAVATRNQNSEITMSKRWTLPDFKKIKYDKSFVIDGPLPLEIDYDDVWQPGVELQAEALVNILNAYWYKIYRLRCNNEDCEFFHDKMFHKADNIYCPECGGLLEEFEVEG